MKVGDCNEFCGAVTVRGLMNFTGDWIRGGASTICHRVKRGGPFLSSTPGQSVLAPPRILIGKPRIARRATPENLLLFPVLQPQPPNGSGPWEQFPNNRIPNYPQLLLQLSLNHYIVDMPSSVDIVR